MATKISSRKLSEEEIYAPDLDEDGELDVEHYAIPLADGDSPLAQAWNEAVRLIDTGQIFAGEDEEDDEEEDDEDGA